MKIKLIKYNKELYNKKDYLNKEIISIIKEEKLNNKLN